MNKYKHEKPMGGNDVLVGVVMGSRSDFEPCMQHACKTLDDLGIPFEVSVTSAHRTAERTRKYAEGAESRGIKIIIAGAGGAAHLAGVIAGQTLVPVFGVPVESPSLKGMDSLLSTVQMPPGVPVACFGIGEWGAINSALQAARHLAQQDPGLAERLRAYVRKKADGVPHTAYE